MITSLLVAQEETHAPANYLERQEALGIQWVHIPEGDFTMGSPYSETLRGPDEKQRELHVDAFYMSSHEITFEQYDAYCKATNKPLAFDQNWGRGKRPAINISWEDAQLFAEWLGARLPTEAEWEYACRAGSQSPFYTGTQISSDEANYNGLHPYLEGEKGKKRGKSIPVGSFPPNAFGLYDMHGNVWEWCLDNYYKNYFVAPSFNYDFESKTGINKSFRGGGWYGKAYNCRSAARFMLNSKKKRHYIGIRLVKMG